MECGRRRCFTNAGQIYYGDVVENKDGNCVRHGLGLQISTATTVTNESIVWGRYNGAWKDDRMTGTGAYHWSDGSVYEGGLVDGRPHGTGKLTWPEGSCYEGAWLSGDMNGQGSFFSAFDGFAVHGQFVRNCIRMYNGEWVNVAQRREKSRAACLRIDGGPSPDSGGPPPTEEALFPVRFCAASEAFAMAMEALKSPPYRVPMVFADTSVAEVGGSNGSSVPLWCLETDERGCTPSSTVHLLHAACSKRRKRDYPQLFRDAIQDALLNYRPFCLVFGNGTLGSVLDSEASPLPDVLSLKEFFDRTSLPEDLFDLKHFHSFGMNEYFLPPETRGMKSDQVQIGDDQIDATHPPVSLPPKLFLLRFFMACLQRIPEGAGEEDVRELVIRHCGQHVPLHRVTVLVVSSA